MDKRPRRRSAGALILVVVLGACGIPSTGADTASTSSSPSTSTTKPTLTTTTATTQPARPTTTSTSSTVPPVPWPEVDGVIDILFPPDGWRTTEPVVDLHGIMVRGATVTVNDMTLDLTPESDDPASGIMLGQGAWWVEIPVDSTGPVSLRVVGEADGIIEETLISTRYDPELESAFGALVAVEGSKLVLDPAVILLGAEAEEYLGTEPVDGYHIVDDEPGVLESWSIADDALIVMIEAVDGMRESAVSVERLGVILAGEDEGSWWAAGQFPVPAFVYVENGVVVQIRVRWAP